MKSYGNGEDRTELKYIVEIYSNGLFRGACGERRHCLGYSRNNDGLAVYGDGLSAYGLMNTQRIDGDLRRVDQGTRSSQHSGRNINFDCRS